MMRSNYQVGAEKFCKVWQESASAAEAAGKLGMPTPIASARAGQYRKRGVHLKYMPRGKRNNLPR